MSLVPSLLQAIVGVDGEALVMHAGDKPYVVAPSGQIELASRGLTLDAVNGIVSQLLPADALSTLEEFGAIQQELAALPEFPGESFTVVAARGGDDVWVEIRRRKVSDDDQVPDDFFSASSASPGSPPAGEQTLQAPVGTDYSEIDDVGPLGPFRSEDARGRVAGGHEIPIGLEALEVPGAPQLFEGRSALVTPEPEVSIPVAAAPPPAPVVVPPPVFVAPPVVVPPPVAPPPPVVAPVSDAAAPVANPVTSAPPPPPIPAGVSGLDRLLRMAAGRGASTLYLSSDARPCVRVDGEIQAFDGEPSYAPKDVESLLLTLLPARSHEALRSGVAADWMIDVDTVGRVRCLSFRDHRGPGAVFRLFRPMSVDRLGLPSEVQSLVLDAGGLVLVAGSRQSGKRTVMSALVDLINRTRRDYIVTLEGEIDVVYDRANSFISQREVGASFTDVEGLAAAALREDPDVLVIESMRSAAVVGVALEAAASGRLVIGGLQAPDVTAAVDYIINLYSPETRCQVQTALAEHLRGIVVQVPLRKASGGRLPAREVLLNTASVASIIAEGRTSELPAAIAAGRMQGMLPLNESLAAFVQSGAVDAREAYRHAADRPGFLATLKRLGLDATPVERLA
jgi:twitching motility protein PilT